MGFLTVSAREITQRETLRSAAFEQELALKCKEFGLREIPESNIRIPYGSANPFTVVSTWAGPNNIYRAAVVFRPYKKKLLHHRHAGPFDVGYYLLEPSYRHSKELDSIPNDLPNVERLAAHFNAHTMIKGYGPSRKLGDFLTQQENKGFELNHSETGVWTLRKEAQPDLQIVDLEDKSYQAQHSYGVKFKHTIANSIAEVGSIQTMSLENFTRLQMSGSDFSTAYLRNLQPAG